MATIAIIGGGISGIVQAKWLLCEGSANRIVLFEKDATFGGVWDISRSIGVMDCTNCNVSKYVMELTHFPWPVGTINFPHHTEVLEYILNYSSRFFGNSALDCRFNCTITWVERVSDDRLVIQYKNFEKAESIEVDHVIIATGHSNVPNIPVSLTEKMNFVSHSATYKNCHRLGLVNKNVLVIGISFSGVDIAVDLIKEGNNHVTVLTRRGSWFSQKEDDKGSPIDIKLPRVFNKLPHRFQNWIIKQKLNMTYFNQTNWKIPIECEPAGGNLVNSEEFVKLIKSDSISVIHGTVVKVAEDRAITIKTKNDGVTTRVFDHIIFCTGYEPSFDFLSDELKSAGVATEKGFYPDLYLNMIPADHSDLISYIGLINTQYTSPFQIIDLQAQFISQKLAGKIKLPAKDVMKASIATQNSHVQRHCISHRGTLFFPSNYQDQIAEAIGKIPHISLIKDPKLWIQYHMGPITWAGYHLEDKELRDSAIQSLDEIFDKAYGKHWFLKIRCIAWICISVFIAVVVLLLF